MTPEDQAIDEMIHDILDSIMAEYDYTLQEAISFVEGYLGVFKR